MLVNFDLKDSFISNSILGSSSLLRLNRFYGNIECPILFSNDMLKYSDLSWNMFQVNCPAMKLGIETKEIDTIPRYFIKNWELEDLTISFIESADLKILSFFYEWMRILGLDSITYNRNYFNDIVSPSFKIYPLDNNNIGKVFHEFREVMPFSISNYDFNLSGTDDDVVMTTISFKYRTHSINEEK